MEPITVFKKEDIPIIKKLIKLRNKKAKIEEEIKLLEGQLIKS